LVSLQIPPLFTILAQYDRFEFDDQESDLLDDDEDFVEDPPYNPDNFESEAQNLNIRDMAVTNPEFYEARAELENILLSEIIKDN